MCSPLALIHAHQAGRVHRPWQKHAESSIKPPGTDQRAVPGSAVVRAPALKPFVGNGRAGDIAQAFEFIALMGAAALPRVQAEAGEAR